MSRISPFVGCLYDRARVGPLERVTTPPYDVISPAEQQRFLHASPYNLIRLDLAEGRPDDSDPGDKYRRAACEYRRWREEGVLVPTEGPAYYPYEMRFTLHGRRRRIRGLVCAVELEDWGGSIVPHEHTMAGPVRDRLELLRALRANLSSIHAVVTTPCPALDELLERSCRGRPTAAMTDEQGVEHRLWVEPQGGRGGRGDAVAEDLRERSLMIADGHHRYTTALRFREEMRAVRGSGPWDAVMMLVVDAATEEPPVLPFHRVVTRGSVPVAGSRVRDLQEVLEEVDDDRLVIGVAAREEGELVHRVATLEGEPPTVCALHEQVLGGPEDDLWYTPDAVEAEEAVRTGRASAAVFLPSTTAARIRATVDRGERLPQKSTYFWPKPRSGMVIRPLEDGPGG
ncbi:MAG: DUF1015 family protein [Candidatus Velamenicoccus archaeovorus]